MTYENALEKIHSLLTFGSRPGLDRMRRFLGELGNPQDKLRYIHVAGTNGKGSVCAVLSSVLTTAGYKTGLFISPYVTDFRERIQIDNQMIDKEILVSAVERTFPIIERLRSEGVIITEFEYVNALQFLIHSEANCNIVVLETGMGGLLDCTNVIKPPLCSVITTIGLDHTAILGDTLEKIAEQKCGIIKHGSVAVTSVQNEAVMKVIQAHCEQKRTPLIESGSIKIQLAKIDLDGSIFDFNGIELNLPLAGAHQLENAKTALAALKALKERNLINFTDLQLQNGFAAAINPARLELLCNDPIVLLDGAHNPNGIEALKKSLIDFLSGKKIICIMGMLADKDIDSAISLLPGVFSKIYTVSVDNPRAISATELAEKFAAHGMAATAFKTPQSAFDKAFEEAKAKDYAVLICGSLYLAGEIRPYIISSLNQPAIQDNTCL